MLLEAQRLLDEGQAKPAVAAQLGVPLDTLRRAVWDGCLTAPLHDTARVINPVWRELERQRATLESKLRHRRARIAAAGIGPPAAQDAHPPAQLQREAETKARHEARTQARREQQQAELLEEAQSMEAELTQLKADKKHTPHPIQWADLPEPDRFEQPLLGRKRLKDAVGMIAYRAETALCGLLRTPLIDNAAARRLLQDLFLTDAGLRPDTPAGLLHIEVHRGLRPAVDRALESLYSQLNEMELVFPAPGVTATSQK